MIISATLAFFIKKRVREDTSGVTKDSDREAELNGQQTDEEELQSAREKKQRVQREAWGGERQWQT